MTCAISVQIRTGNLEEMISSNWKGLYYLAHAISLFPSKFDYKSNQVPQKAAISDDQKWIYSSQIKSTLFFLFIKSYLVVSCSILKYIPGDDIMVEKKKKKKTGVGGFSLASCLFSFRSCRKCWHVSMETAAVVCKQSKVLLCSAYTEIQFRDIWNTFATTLSTTSFPEIL